MLYLAVTIFPIIAIGCGVASLYSVVRFVAEIQRDIRRASLPDKDTSTPQ